MVGKRTHILVARKLIKESLFFENRKKLLRGNKTCFPEKTVATAPRLATFAPAMARRGGKAKTRKSVAKRFKVTGSGRILRRKQGKRHLMRRKNAKRRRRLGQSTLAAKCDEKNIKAEMPFDH